MATSFVDNSPTLTLINDAMLLTLENIHVLEGRGWGKVLRILIKYNHNIMIKRIREDTHKKVFFLVVGPLRFYLPYTNGLMVLPPFFLFFSLIIAWNGFWQFFLFLPNFWAKPAELKKKMFFCLVARGVYPHYTLSGPTTKRNTFFMCVFP